MRLKDIAKTLNLFFSKFGQAYLKNYVPNDAEKPYITYTVEDSELYEDNIMQVMVYGNTLEEVINIADEIEKKIGTGILVESVEGQFISIYVRKGSPFSQPINNADSGICCYINIITKIL